MSYSVALVVGKIHPSLLLGWVFLCIIDWLEAGGSFGDLGGGMSTKPKCIIVTGRGGSGKTTLSKKLAQQLWMPVISRDEIKEGYVNTFGVKHDDLPPETNGIVSNFFFETVKHYLNNKVSVIIEAAFQHRIWETRMDLFSELSHPFFIVCSIDTEVAAKRHLERGLADARREFYHGDKSVSVFRETGVLPPSGDYAVPKFDVPTIHVSTVDEYVPSLDEIVKKIK